MHLELLIPDLIAPAASATDGLSLSALELLLGRGVRTSSVPVSIEDWLADAAGIDAGPAVPYAAISALGDGAVPGTAGWIRADPVNVRPERDHLLLDASASATLDHEQAAQLVATLNQHFFDDGMRFAAANARRWYVETARPPRVTMVPLAAAAAADNNVDAMRPAGEDAMLWQRVGNEVQMLLHEHPVNVAREQRGEPPINSVWFWGAGVLPHAKSWRFARTFSNESMARGFALLCNSACAAAPLSAAHLLAAPDTAAGSGRQLIVLEGLRSSVTEQGLGAWRAMLQSYEQAWFAPLLAALRDERIGMLSIHAPSPRCALSVEVIRFDLNKIWRRAKPLAAYASLEAPAVDTE